jgi:exosortase D (VPLPA-CTERM-specific)
VPILFLAFAIPLPYFLDASLSWRLQIVSSQMGVWFIRLFQIPVFLQGNVIDLGVYKIQVVDACSGLRYLYPLLSLSFLAAYLFQAPFWQRAVIFLSAIPITIVMNSARIGLVGILVNSWGPQDADGLLHMFEGWIIFLACAGILVAEMSLLAWFGSGKGFFELFYPPTINVRSKPHDQVGRGIRYASPISCLVLLIAVGLAASFVSTRQEINPERKSFATFPTTLGDWKGHSSTIGADIEKGLGFSDYILSDFAKPKGRPVNLYVAYYASQRSGISPHSPSVCIPGNGWQITEFERINIRNNDTSLPINRAIITRGSEKQLVYYWYEERGMAIANEYWSKLLLLRDAILKNRTDGALIRLITPIYPGEGEHDADKRLQEFAGAVTPTLAKYLPEAPSKLAAAVTPLNAAVQR